MSAPLSYSEKFAMLNQQMRWEVADELRAAYLGHTNTLQELVEVSDNFYTRYGKRALDVTVASGALLATLPINGILFVITLADLGWPPTFSQKRLGRDGDLFVLHKLRTMREGYDDQGRPLLGEHRVTRLGRLVRRSSLDELLNFWSILKGDMSLIGPRPLVPEYLNRLSARHRQRLAVKPGLECPQRHPLDHAASYEEQFENDCWYVSHVSFRTDLWMIFRVAATVLDRRQNAARGSSSRGSFMGYDQEGGVVTTRDLPEWALDKVLRRHGLLPTEHVTSLSEARP